MGAKSDHEGPAERDDRGWTARALLLGTNLVAGMVIFVLLGRYVDGKRGGGTGWTLCGMFLGLAYGGYEVWKLVRDLDRRSEAKRPAPDKTRGAQTPPKEQGQ